RGTPRQGRAAPRGKGPGRLRRRRAGGGPLGARPPRNPYPDRLAARPLPRRSPDARRPMTDHPSTDASAFRGVLPALVTPMHPDGAIDRDALDAVVESVVAGGVHGVVPCGTTGESATLTPEEQRGVIAR